MLYWWLYNALNEISFFFFQAEDGIRDGTVTGVQTCALPICSTGPPHWARCLAEGRNKPPTPLPAAARPRRHPVRGKESPSCFPPGGQPLAQLLQLHRKGDRFGAKRDRRDRYLEQDFLREDDRWDDLQAVLIHLRRLAFIDIVQLFGSAQDVAGGHLHLGAALIEEGELGILPCGVTERIRSASALGQPEVPQPVTIRVVEVEDRVLRGGRHGAHPSAHVHMDGTMRSALDDAAGRGEVDLRKRRTVTDVGSRQ